MKIHEYQAKELFRRAGVPVPNGRAAFSIEEAVDVAKELSGPVWVVKAQIHAGGRGKGGGVKLARSIDEVKEHASSILGMMLVTKQTGPEGKLVKRLLVEEGCNIDREIYLAFVLDRSKGRVQMIACGEGGMEIEEVAAKSPEKILKVDIDPFLGLHGFELRRIAKSLNITGDTAKQFIKACRALYDVYVKYDCSLVEVNPAVITKEGGFMAIDAKINFDDNALYRHPEIEELRDPDEEDPREMEAAKFGLNYISLDGNIGCMVNGAGLAMATMDIIKLYGGEPANFLDVGGGVTQDAVREAFRILLSDDRVKGILVNIFGGIVRCDVIAGGIMEAAKGIKIDRPLVVRLEGTNVEQGMKMLNESGLPLQTASGMAEAAEKITALVKEGE